MAKGVREYADLVNTTVVLPKELKDIAKSKGLNLSELLREAIHDKTSAEWEIWEEETQLELLNQRLNDIKKEQEFLQEEKEAVIAKIKFKEKRIEEKIALKEIEEGTKEEEVLQMFEEKYEREGQIPQRPLVYWAKQLGTSVTELTKKIEKRLYKNSSPDPANDPFEEILSRLQRADESYGVIEPSLVTNLSKLYKVEEEKLYDLMRAEGLI